MPKWAWPVIKASGAVAAGVVVVLTIAGFQQEDAAGGGVTTAVGTYQAPQDLDTAGLAGPEQPIFFRHDIHSGQYGLDCRYCHAYAEVAANPGLPPASLCMGCHRLVATSSPEVQKLQQAVNEGTPIAWAEVHPLPQFVRFPHHRHVAVAELACQTCHGQVEQMARVYQYASLKMGWCVSCHERSTYADDPERPVTTDCTACHY